MGKASGEATAGLGLEEAPVFYPSEDEFLHPMKYIASIRERAEQYGMCKIVPPSSWNPPFALDPENFVFKTKVQAIHQLQERPAGCDPDTFRLEYKRFCERERLPLLPWPLLEGEVLDLCKLFNAVRRRGGFKRVSRERRWGEVLRMVAPEKGVQKGEEISESSATRRLSDLYEKYLLLYEQYHADPGAPLVASSEIRAKMMSEERRLEEQEGKALLQVKMKDLNEVGGPKGSRLGRAKHAKHSRNGESLLKRERDGEGERENGTAEERGGDAREPLDGAPEAKKLKLEKENVEVVEQIFLIDQLCEQCHGGGHEEAMLLCDRCDRGWHIYCLSPPLQSVPEGNWYCLDCVNSKRESFGFCTGEEHTLGSFQRMAERFKKKWFGSEARAKTPSAAETEGEFWRIVERSTQPVDVLYGSDLDTSQCGSGFPRNSDACPQGKTKELWQKYANSPWNLNNMPKADGSVLQHIDDNIPGVIVPWLYIGMAFSSFCWHYEDHCFYSINYLHWGEPKHWYGVPGVAAEAFEGVMKEAFPDLFEAQPDLLFQLVTMLSPVVLKENKVPVYSCLQEARQFVITFPRSYHGGFNHGFNCAEAVNFAPPDWLPWGGCGVERYRLFRRSAILSHEELLCVVAKNKQHDLETLQWLHKELHRIINMERKHRFLLWTEGTVRSTRMAARAAPDRIGQDEDPECIICKYYLHLSSVTCSCRPGEAVCLQHAKQLCECLPSQRTLHYRHTLSELEDFLHPTEQEESKRQPMESSSPTDFQPSAIKRQKLTRGTAKPLGTIYGSKDSIAVLRKKVKGRSVSHAEQAHIWATRAKGVLRTSPTFQTVEGLLQEAEEFLWGGNEVAPVRDIAEKLQSAKEWAEQVAICCRGLNSPEGKSQPKDPRGRGVPLAKVEELINVDPAPCLEPHLMELKGLHSKAKALQERIAETLAVRPPVELRILQGLYQEALRAPVEIPEMKLLKDNFSTAQAWIDAVRKVLPTSKAFRRRPQSELPTLPYLQTLRSQGETLPVRLGEHSVLDAAISRVEEWRGKAVQLLASKPTLQEVEAALEEADNVPAMVEEMEELRKRLETTEEWAERARLSLFPPRASHGAATWHAASVAALQSLILEGSQLKLEVQEMKWLEAQVKKLEWVQAASQALAEKTEVEKLVKLSAEAASMRLSGDLAVRIRQASEKASLWEVSAGKALQEGAQLEDFAGLVRSAEGINAKLRGAEEVFSAFESARKWQERAQPFLRGKLRGRQRNSTEKLSFKVLQELVAQLPTMIVLMKEAEYLKVRLAEAEEWRVRAEKLLATPLFPSLCRTSTGPCSACLSHGLWGHIGSEVVEGGRRVGGGGEKPGDAGVLGAKRIALLEAVIDDGLALGLDVEQVKELQVKVQGVKWQVKAQKLLESNGFLTVLKSVLQDGSKLLASGIPVDAESYAALERAFEKGQKWVSQADSIIGGRKPESSPWKVEQLETLLSEAQTLPVVVVEEVGNLQAVLSSHRLWLAEAQLVLSKKKLGSKTSISELSRILDAGERSGVECEEIYELQRAQRSMKEWVEASWEVLAKPTDHAARSQDRLLLLLNKVKSTIERAFDLVAREGPVPVPPSTNQQAICACLRVLETEHKSSMLHCDSCKDWFHEECLGPSNFVKQTGKSFFTCPFCAALCTGRLAIPKEVVNKMHCTKGPTLTSLKELSQSASALPCRSEEMDSLERVVELSVQWEARLKELLTPALELPRGSSPLTGPALVLIMKAAGTVEVERSELSLVPAAIAAQAWRVRACRLMLSPTKPTVRGLVQLLEEGRALVGEADGVLREVQEREAQARAWLTRGRQAADDDGEIPVEKVLQLVKQGEKLPVDVEKELQVLRDRCELFCSCKRPYNSKRPMGFCRHCKEWFHYSCVKLPEPPTTLAHIGPHGKRESPLWDSVDEPVVQTRIERAGKQGESQDRTLNKRDAVTKCRSRRARDGRRSAGGNELKVKNEETPEGPEFICLKCTAEAKERERQKTLSLHLKALQEQVAKEGEQDREEEQQEREPPIGEEMIEEKAEEVFQLCKGDRTKITSTRSKRTPSRRSSKYHPPSTPPTPSPPFPPVRVKRSARSLPSALKYTVSTPGENFNEVSSASQHTPSGDGESERLPSWPRVREAVTGSDTPQRRGGEGGDVGEARQSVGGRPCRRTAGRHSGYDGFILLPRLR